MWPGQPASTMIIPQHWYIQQRDGSIYIRYLPDGPLRDMPEREAHLVKYRISEHDLIVYSKNDAAVFTLKPEYQHAAHPWVFSALMEFVMTELERYT